MHPLQLFLQNVANESPESARQAHKMCHALLEQDPNNVSFWQLMSVIEYKLGHPTEGEQCLRKCLRLAPRSVEILCNYALMQLKQQKFIKAISLLRYAVRLQPDYIPSLFYLGNACKGCGKQDEAIAAFEKVLALQPNHAATLNDLGNLIKDMGHPSESKSYYERAIAAEPNNSFYINNLGVAHYAMGEWETARHCHEEAIKLKQDYPAPLCNLAALARGSGEFEQAVAYCRQALALNPEYPEALNNLGNALKDCGRLQESIEAYRHAARLKPNDPEILHNLAMALLTIGEFDEGWRLYEERWKIGQLAHAYRNYPQPLWQGEAAERRVLFIHAEQGFGDTLQFCRYAPLAVKRGLRVVLEAQPALVRLMQSLDGVETVVSPDEKFTAFDFHCPMMSLPHAFKTRLETIPASIPYLKADAKDAALWREQIAALAPAGKRRIGLVWAGNPRRHSPILSLTDGRRSIAPELLQPLFKTGNAVFFSLQKDGQKAPEELGLVDLMDNCQDFADTAALLANLDLVITVDTAMAHLAGALGIPTWVLNRFDSCWRWPRDKETTPWYPTMRLFHQPQPGDWKSVIAQVARELE